MNTKAYEKLNYALALLSAANGDKRHGCIINSLHQATSSYPAKFTITVSKDHETYKAVQAAGSFSVTLLAADCPEELVDLFGYKSGRVKDKFADYAFKTDGAGNPYLTEHMVSRISCKVVNSLEIGNYVLLVGEATEAEVLGEGPALTLQDFANRGKATPPAATAYRTVEINGYRCTVCGYVYEGESLPADFRCPLCNAPAEKFVKIEK
jgi:flavin reductase (DIM6/NTAB) family NADH-FMN oxidoreductase RutF